MTIYGLKVRVKSGLKNYFEIPHCGLFRVAAAQFRKICPEGPNWPGWLAGISEGARGISKQFFLDYFSPSYLIQKWSFQDLRF